MSHNLKYLINRLFLIAFAIFLSWTLLAILGWNIISRIRGTRYFLFDGIYEEPLSPLVIFIGLLMLTLIMLYTLHYLYNLEEITHQRLVIIISGIILTLQFVFAYIYQVEPKSWDFQVIYSTARDLAQGSNILDHYFYDDYANNIGVTLLLSGIYKLFFVFRINHPHIIGIILNIIMIDISLLILYLTSRKLFGLKASTLLMGICMIFSPFITYVPIYYTDTLSIPFGIGIIYLYILSLDAAGKKNYLMLFSLSALGLIGFILKPTIIIIIIALLFHMLLTNRPYIFIKNAALIIIVLFIGLKSYSFALDHSKLLPIPYNQAGYPVTHWIMMGLKPPYGFYNAQDVNYTDSFNSKEARREANIREIKKRISDYGPIGLAVLLNGKNLFIWGDGTYFAPVKLNRGVRNYSQFHNYVLALKNNENYLYIYFSQIVHLCLLILLFISVVFDIRSCEISILTLCRIAVFGLALFLLLWEARSRYLLNFSPIIILCSFDGLIKLEKQFVKKLKSPQKF